MSGKGICSFDPANLCQIAIVVKSIDETVGRLRNPDPIRVISLGGTDDSDGYE